MAPYTMAPCPDMNLPHAEPRLDLDGRSPAEVLKDFCERARIADLSEVVGLSERGRIVELLNAA